MMMLFFKRMGAKRFAKRALRVVYADNHCFRLWRAKAVYEYLRPFEKGDLRIETKPNVYFSGATVPSVIVYYKTKPVFATTVRFIGSSFLGENQVVIFEKGAWIDILNDFYREAKASKAAYR